VEDEQWDEQQDEQQARDAGDAHDEGGCDLTVIWR
jgi:hypothetical protein